MKPKTLPKTSRYLKSNAVVDLLKAGEMIECRVQEYFGQRGQLVYSSLRYSVAGKLIHAATIGAMIRRKVIHGPDLDKSKCYTLTRVS